MKSAGIRRLKIRAKSLPEWVLHKQAGFIQTDS